MEEKENFGSERQWSGEELRSDFPACSTLSEVVSKVSDDVKGRGAVICQVIVNGVKLTEDQEARYQKMPAGEIRTFGVRIQDVGVLLDESLASCSQYLGKLGESMDKAAELFRTDDLASAQKYYQACLDGAGLFIDMAKHLKVVFESQRGKIPFDWENFESVMAAVLRQILDAYRDRNYILVADLLEYELVGVLNRWQQDLAKLGRHKTKNDGIDSKVKA